MEIGLKERLIGAVVLVVLGVIIIPLFIKSAPAPDTAADQMVTPSPAGGTAIQQVTLPLNAAPAAATAPTAQAPVAASAPQPAHNSIPRSPSTAAPEAAGKWTVQAGSYGSEANADKVAKTLQQHGFQASVSRLTKSGRTYFRVRVSSYVERAEAEKAAAAVAKAYGGKAEVVPNS